MSKAVAMLLAIAIMVAPLPIMGTHKAIASQSTATLSEFAAWQLYHDDMFYSLQAKIDMDLKAKFAIFENLPVFLSFLNEIRELLSNILQENEDILQDIGSSDRHFARGVSMEYAIEMAIQSQIRNPGINVANEVVNMFIALYIDVHSPSWFQTYEPVGDVAIALIKRL